MHCTVPEAVALAGRIEDGLEDIAKDQPLPTVVLCPPFTALSAVSDVIQHRSISLGAQDVHWADHGPHTGEISPTQLKDLVQYVIIGHSERRESGETNEIVARKLKAVVTAGLIPILCVGEKELTSKAASEVATELKESLAEIEPKTVPDLLIAYEPVWAIGTGDVAESGHIAEVATHLKKTAAKIGISDGQVLYGGSVDRDNVERVVDISELDGLLVGGSSLSDQSFVSIVSAVSRHG